MTADIPMPPSSGGSSESTSRTVLEELANALDRAESAGLLGAAFVIFIDDLHRHFIESGSRNVQAALQSLVNRPQAPLMVASVSDGFLQLDDPASNRIGVPRAHRTWLRDRAITWPGRFDAGEEANASVLFERQLHDGALGAGDLLRLPAALAAVPELVGRIEHARSDRAQLPRSALVFAALDAAILDPAGLTAKELRQATEQRFALSAPTRPPLSDTQWQDALEWGTDDIGEVWAILDRGVVGLSDSEPRWRLMDALGERLLPGHEVDDALLDALEERQYDNLVRHTYEVGDADRAMFLARKGHEKGFASSTLYVGILLDDREGTFSEIVDYYLDSLAAGYPLAALHLADLHRRHGDTKEADLFYRYSIDARDPRANAAFNWFLWEEGRLPELEDRLRTHAEFEDGSVMYGLGMAHAASGELSDAEYWFRRSLQEWTSQAMAELGEVLERQGDLAGAEHWYREAIEDGDDLGIILLGCLLEKKGEGAQAEALFREGSRRDAISTVFMGGLLARRGDLKGAEEWYRRATQTGDRTVGREIGFHALTALLDDQGRTAESRQVRAELSELTNSQPVNEKAEEANDWSQLRHLSLLTGLVDA